MSDRKYHVLVKELAINLWDSDPEYSYRLECPGGSHCDGWTECRESHEVGGIKADAGPDGHIAGCGWGEECRCEDLPWANEEEFTFHGVHHTWQSTCGWVVPYNGCVLNEFDLGEDDVTRSQPPGRYLVDPDWFDEYTPILQLIGPEEQQ